MSVTPLASAIRLSFICILASVRNRDGALIAASARRTRPASCLVACSAANR
jgi:hypothetical protein